jgi:hypothetical protein
MREFAITRCCVISITWFHVCYVHAVTTTTGFPDLAPHTHYGSASAVGITFVSFRVSFFVGFQPFHEYSYSSFFTRMKTNFSIFDIHIRTV